MSWRAKIIITTAAAVVVALLIVLIVAGRRTAQSIPTSSLTANPLLNSPPLSPPLSPALPLGVALRTGTVSLEVLARSFVERYGSFSNQSDFANLQELLPFMTGALRQDALARMARPASAGAAYAGTTTKALAIKEQKVSEASATFLITTQRRESTAQNPSARVYYQDIELTLLKIGEDWKVDRAAWQ